MSTRTAKVKYDDRDSTHIPERDGDWSTWYQARHAKAKGDAEVKRIDALIRKAEKKAKANAKAAASGKPRKPLEGAALEIANGHRDRADRLRRDTQAFLAANPKLPSEAHAILQLWVQKLPKGKRLMVGDDKTYVDRACSKLLGLRAAYVVGDANMRGHIRIDLDESFGTTETSAMPWDAPSPTWRADSQAWGDLRSRIAATGAPLANVAVGYADEVDHVERPHLIFLLKDSVFCGVGADFKFRGKIDGIARRLVASMIEIGADPGGLSNSCKTKNPLSPAWSMTVLREEPWTLDELAAALPIPVSQRQLERKHAAWLASRAPKDGLVADHPDPVIASASNQAHRHVCKAAQAVVRQYRKTSTFEAFRAFVLDKALEVCPDPESAVKKADYVAPWTWSKFNGRVPGQRQDPEAVRAARSASTRAINWNRKLTTMQAVLAAYAALPEELGRKPMVSEVAAWAGVSENSVRRYRPAAASNPVGQQVDVCCPQKNSPRSGVVKKVLDISRDGNGLGEANAAPEESRPVEKARGQVSPATPVTDEPIPESVTQDRTRPIPAPATPARMPPLPSFLKPRHSPAVVETKPCPSTTFDLSTTPPSPLAPPAMMTKMTMNISTPPSTPVPTCSPSCGALPTRSLGSARSSAALISLSETLPATPRSSGGSRNRLSDPAEFATTAPPCDPSALTLSRHLPATQSHHGGQKPMTDTVPGSQASAPETMETVMPSPPAWPRPPHPPSFVSAKPPRKGVGKHLTS